jgi:hypothetical protein
MTARSQIDPTSPGWAGKTLRHLPMRLMRLNVPQFAAEQFCHALDRGRSTSTAASAVVAFAREPFGILVGENRSLRFKHHARRYFREAISSPSRAAKLKFDGVVDLRSRSRNAPEKSRYRQSLFGSSSPTFASPRAAV